MGGTVGNCTEIYEGSPAFEKNQEYLLCLYQPNCGGAYNTKGDYYYVCGINQGVFTRDDSGGYVSLSGETLPDSRLEPKFRNVSINGDYTRKEFVENQEKNLANGFITKEEYDAAMAQLNQYAEILN